MNQIIGKIAKRTNKNDFWTKGESSMQMGKEESILINLIRLLADYCLDAYSPSNLFNNWFID